MSKYCYNNLLMGDNNSTEILHQKVDGLLQHFKFIRSHIYNILVLTKVHWTDHIQKPKITLNIFR